MSDSEPEAISDTFDEAPIEDREDGTLDDVDLAEIVDGDTLDPEEIEGEADGEEIQPDDDPEVAEGEVRVTLDDGTETTLDELKRGNLREQDYTAKTMELADARTAFASEQSALQQRVETVNHAYNSIAQLVHSLIPAEPALEMARTDPGGYQYAKAEREAAIGELNQILESKNGFGEVQQQFSQEDFAAMQSASGAELVKAFPNLKDPAAMAAFNATNRTAALDFGFTDQEIQSTTDPRILQLVHYARIGKQKIANRANAKRRVEAPKKGKARPAVAQSGTGNGKAMERLRKTGSIDDAMSIDFD